MGTRSIARRLIIMRHAKSSWKNTRLDDHERPLNKRGKKNAPAVARELMNRGWTPTVILASDSRRTEETVEFMQKHLVDVHVEYRPDFYLAGIDAIRHAVSDLPASVRTVLVLGHNPGWDEAVSWLAGEPVSLKTADAALLSGAGRTWDMAVAHRASWQLIDVVRGRNPSAATG